MTASSLTFSTGPTFWKQPTFVASLVSIGLHGLVFTFLSTNPPASSEEAETFQSIEVVELSPTDAQRLPAFAQPTAPATPAFPLPASALPSLTDLSRDLGALADLGANSLATTPPPPPNSPLPQYNWSDWLPPPPQNMPAPVPLPPIRTTNPIPLPRSLPNTDLPPVAPPRPADPPPNPPTTATPDPNAPPPVSTSARDLLPGSTNPTNPTNPTSPTPTPTPVDPYQELRDRYRQYSVGALDPGSASGVLSQLMAGSWSGLQLERGDDVTLAFPNAVCPEDAGTAAVAVKVSPSGTAEEVKVYLETGYAALDNETRRHFSNLGYPAADTPKVYQHSVTYEDQGGCEVWVNRNAP